MPNLETFWLGIYTASITRGLSNVRAKATADKAVDDYKDSNPAAPSTNAMLPVYRLRNGGEHFYTISETEKDNAISQYGYTYEGIAFYACEAPNE